MHDQGLVTMSMREVDRMKVIQAVADGHLARWRAAERLGISARHVRRLVLRLQEDGPSGLVSRKRDRPSNRQLPPGLESRIRGLIRDSYADFGPTLACEKLRERHGIEISKACVRRIMIDAGFWIPRKRPGRDRRAQAPPARAGARGAGAGAARQSPAGRAVAHAARRTRPAASRAAEREAPAADQPARSGARAGARAAPSESGPFNLANGASGVRSRRRRRPAACTPAPGPRTRRGRCRRSAPARPGRRGDCAAGAPWAGAASTAPPCAEFSHVRPAPLPYFYPAKEPNPAQKARLD
ncbi:protein of unknown function [Cupriavidus taiwanensis]|nr:protein of unknown function [Cupriavidus taiwanensis]